DVDVAVRLWRADLAVEGIGVGIVFDLHRSSFPGGGRRLNTAETTTIRSGSSRHVTRAKRPTAFFQRLIRPPTDGSSQSGVWTVCSIRSSAIPRPRIRCRAWRVIRVV